MQANSMIIQLNKKNILPDTVALIGVLFDFLFYGTTLGQFGYLLVIAIGAYYMLQHRSVKIQVCSFHVFYFLLMLYFAFQIWRGNSIAMSISSAYLSTMFKCWVYMVFAYQYLMRRSFREITTFFTMFSLLITAYLILTGAMFSGGRLQASGVNANSIGMHCAITMALIGYRFLTNDCRRPMVYGVVFLLLGIIVILTGSRKALLICGIPLLLYYVFRKKRHLFLRVVLVVLMVFVAYLLLMTVPALYDTIGYRIEGMLSWMFTGETTEASMRTRTKFIEIGFAAFRQRPWTGYGLASFSVLPGSYGTYSHNNFVEMLVSGGIPAVVLFYLPFLLLIIRLFKQRKSSDTSVFLLMVLICRLVLHSAVVVYYSRTSLFIYLFIFAAVRQEETKESDEVTPIC